MKISKFHRILHCTDIILGTESMQNSASGPLEHTHIQSVKRPAERTRKRKSCLEKEAADRVYESLVSNRIYQTMYRVHTHHSKDSIAKKTTTKVCGGSSFFVVEEKLWNGERIVSTKWRSAKNVGEDDANRRMANQYCCRALGHLFKQDPKDDMKRKIPCFTEYKLDGNIFRAHPAYRKGTPWYDHCSVEWNSEEGPVDMPARIEMFVDLRHANFDSDPEENLKKRKREIAHSVDLSEGPGFYAIVRSFAGVPKAATKSQNSRFVLSGTMAKGMYVIHVGSITRPCAVVDHNSRDHPNNFLVIESPEYWADMFEENDCQQES